jgi:two-component system, chemotaxis family, sensor kinase CheA
MGNRWVYLSDLLELPNLPQSNRESCSYVLLGDGQRQVAIAVDDLEDESEVLLKPLEYPLSQLPGIVGATVRSNGTVQFVLDTSENGLCRASKPTTRPTSTATVAGRILIADDSPTTRTILRNLLSAAGYAVITASDGVDALERLKNQQVDLVVSDVEMPRLNGIDLARQIKLQFGYPVILVTGREKEQHRREGLEAGADAYVVKSTFEGDGLLEIVRQFV